jgi:hypothetical protein
MTSIPEHLNLDDEWRVCDCAGCNALCYGESMLGRIVGPRSLVLPYIKGRFKQRPYCPDCWRIMIERMRERVKLMTGRK